SAWPPDSPTTSAATSTGRRTCSSDFCGAPASIRPNSRRSNAPIVGDNVAPRAGSEAHMKPPVAMLLIALVPAAISAHHSVVAYYDTNTELTLKGSVTKIEWTNPHAFVYLDVRDDRGVVTN